MAQTTPPNETSQADQTPRRWPHELHRPVVWIAIVVVILALVLIGIFGRGHDHKQALPTTTSGVSAQVLITSAGFIPKTITIDHAIQVTWLNQDNKAHQVAADPYPKNNSIPGFDSTQLLQTNDTYSFSFQKPGTYHYHDEVNPYTYQGTVIVK